MAQAAAPTAFFWAATKWVKRAMVPAMQGNMQNAWIVIEDFLGSIAVAGRNES